MRGWCPDCDTLQPINPDKLIDADWPARYWKIVPHTRAPKNAEESALVGGSILVELACPGSGKLV